MRLGAKKALLACAALVVALGGAELVLRVIVSVRGGSMRPLVATTVTPTVIERADSIRNHALIAGQVFVSTGTPAGFEFWTHGQINAQGMNDDVVPIEKPARELRVLVLGDSFVEARQVERRLNFTQLLQRDLSARTNRPVRVMNAGVSSYSPLLCYLYFTRELAQYRPDIVVLAVFANDVFDDLRYTSVAQAGPDGVPVAVRAGRPWATLQRGQNRASAAAQDLRRDAASSADASFWSSHFYLGALARHVAAIATPRPSETPKNDEFFILEDDADLVAAQQEGWRLTQHYLALLKEACDRAQASFVLTSVPIASQITGTTSYDHFFFSGKPTEANRNEVRRIATELRVPYVDLFDPLKRAGAGSYFPRDGHWTPQGHRVVATALRDGLAGLVR